MSFAWQASTRLSKNALTSESFEVIASSVQESDRNQLTWRRFLWSQYSDDAAHRNVRRHKLTAPAPSVFRAGSGGAAGLERGGGVDDAAGLVTGRLQGHLTGWAIAGHVQLGAVTVNDARASATLTWTTAVTSTAFATGGGDDLEETISITPRSSPGGCPCPSGTFPASAVRHAM